MLSNLTSQLKEQHAEDKFYDVLEEVPRVRKDLGEPPACYSVFSDRWYTGCIQRTHGREIQDGNKRNQRCSLLENTAQTVKPFNPEVQKKCIGDAEIDYLPSGRPA